MVPGGDYIGQRNICFAVTSVNDSSSSYAVNSLKQERLVNFLSQIKLLPAGRIPVHLSVRAAQTE